MHRRASSVALALALRLAGHRLVTDRIDSAPVLLLDDVFSELDPAQARTPCSAALPGRASHIDHRRESFRPAPISPPGSGSRTGSCSSDDLEADSVRDLLRDRDPKPVSEALDRVRRLGASGLGGP